MFRTLCMIPLFLLLPLSAQQRTVTGTVKDRESGQPLPSATVRIAGSMQGTITNTEGEFRLPVQGGKVILTASYIGFESDSIRVESSGTAPVEFRLTANAVQLAAVTVTDEDPAYEIIRRAIESKKRWMAKLLTFEGKAFNRMEISTDSSIAAITEGYSTLY